MSTDEAGPERATDATPDAEIEALRAEVDRLRSLVGPSEESYEKLRLDVLAARDAALGAEAALGNAEGYSRSLEAEVTRLQRDQEWFRHEVIARLRRLRPTWSKTIGRLSR
jgi:predicted  nucleic acid-binding Zn-ribbon protein